MEQTLVCEHWGQKGVGKACCLPVEEGLGKLWVSQGREWSKR